MSSENFLKNWSFPVFCAKIFFSNNDEDSRTFSVIQSVKFDRVLNTFATDPVGHLGISPNAVLIG